MFLANFATAISNFFGADRYSPLSVALANEGVMILLYSAINIMMMTSLLTVAACFLTLAMRCTAKEVQDGKFMVVLSGSTLFLYGLTFLFLAAGTMTSTAVLFVGVWRLDIAVRAAGASISLVAATYTAWAVWGPGHDISDLRVEAV